MQRREHMGRANYGASQSRPTETKRIKSLRDLIFLFVSFLFKLGTALSNVRRDGVV